MVSPDGCYAYNNFRLHPEQVVYIINMLKTELFWKLFLLLCSKNSEANALLRKYVLLCSKEEMPETKLKDAISYEEFMMEMKHMSGRN